MKKYLIHLILSSSLLFAQSPFNLPDDSASFGVFIFDYPTGGFEEGTVLNVPPCNNCDSIGVPFYFDYQEPGDEGWDIFYYSENDTGDTIFFASIMWMGLGEIIFPDVFYNADSFLVEIENAPDPDTLEYWSFNEIQLDNGSLPGTADTAYQQIRKLSLVHEFAEDSYQILVYLYTPTVGATDLAVAKWIFFLFRNPQELDIGYENNGLLEKFRISAIYPNPFNPSTTIRFNIPVETQHAVSLRIYDITGRVVETLVNGKLMSGEHEVVWNASGFSSGIYFVRLQSNSFVETQKIVLVK